ncbi:tumor necrosis factor receptor superfamily member 14-like isoform X5 [Perca fluviatilis]|uniref:tumor necrosis factor receptor superfamily member 14-like isoform X5 n=1 Tax=Perca fluviatilis TaxID=8168 RepID=UPI0019652991|nr:tumor necrosis factor receptor superfamily member 14-like isoform X5 [Perca fluviatilis]
METVILPYTMMFRKHLTVAPLLILVLSVFRGHTLTCHPTEYLNGDQCCPTCSVGSRVKKHCTEFRSTSCLDCDKGTYMNLPTGLTECFPCARCDSGNSCVEAQKHRSCQPGQYISQNGTALSDTECSDCSDGTFSNGTLLTSCQPHTQCQSLDLQLIKPGTASTDAECGEQSSGAGIGVVVVLVILLVVAGISLPVMWILRKKGRCKNTGERGYAENPQPNGNLNGEEQLQDMDLKNKHRDRLSDTAEESSRLNENQLYADTL